MFILIALSSWHYHKCCSAKASRICTIQKCFYCTVEDLIEHRWEEDIFLLLNKLPSDTVFLVGFNSTLGSGLLVWQVTEGQIYSRLHRMKLFSFSTELLVLVWFPSYPNFLLILLPVVSFFFPYMQIELIFKHLNKHIVQFVQPFSIFTLQSLDVPLNSGHFSTSLETSTTFYQYIPRMLSRSSKKLPDAQNTRKKEGKIKYFPFHYPHPCYLVSTCGCSTNF